MSHKLFHYTRKGQGPYQIALLINKNNYGLKLFKFTRPASFYC
jgi:hypothetical protein